MRAISAVLNVSRSNLSEKIKGTKKVRSRYEKSSDRELLEEIKVLIKERPSYGYRRITTLLTRKMCKNVNPKRVYRVMKIHNLLLRKPDVHPKRCHTGKIETMSSNMRWCSDHFSIQCWNGDQVHVAFSLDTCDREAMKWVASSQGISGEAIRDLMLETIEYRFGKDRAPYSIQWLSDNGSCYVARETVAFGLELGFDIRTTPVRSPESNGMSEALVKTLKRDYVAFGDLSSAEIVLKQLNGWFDDYNEKAPHKALGMKSPREFNKKW
jgi:putative transposase